MTETTTPVEETSSSIQPGNLTAKLAACREKAGLNIEQAADEMHLSVNLLRALEQEDFSHLPEPPYVRGYLRGYAKLADIDPSDLIRTYEALRGANPDEIAHHFAPARSLGKISEPAISPGVFKLLGMLFLVGLVVLIAMIPAVRDWASNTWASLSAQTTPPQVVRPAPALQTFTATQDAKEKLAASAPATPASTTATPVPAPAVSAPADSPANTTPAAAPAPVAMAAATTADSSKAAGAGSKDGKPVATDQPAAGSTPVTATDTTKTATSATPATAAATDKTVDAATTPAATATTPATASAPAATAAPGTTTPAATATVPGATAPAAAGTSQNPADTATATAAAPGTPDTAATATPPQPINGEVTVKLEFSEEVWMQVKDDKKKVMFESLNSSGTTKEFKASTPLDFKVGNAHGVKVYLNGQLYDQAPYTKGSVSRFKVE